MLFLSLCFPLLSVYGYGYDTESIHKIQDNKKSYYRASKFREQRRSQASLTTEFDSPELIWWKDTTNVCKLSSDFYMHAIAHVHPHTHIHTFFKKLKKRPQ